MLEVVLVTSGSNVGEELKGGVINSQDLAVVAC